MVDTYEGCQSMIACSTPLCNWSCQVTDCPKKISSSNLCKIQAFQYNQRAGLWNFSHDVRIFWLYLVIAQTKWCNWDLSPQLRHLYLCWLASRAISVLPSHFWYWPVLHLSLSWPWNVTGSSESTLICNVAHIFGMFRVCPAIFVVHKNWQRIIAVYDDGKGTPIWGRLSILLQSELSQMYLPSAVLLDRHFESQCCGLLALGNLNKKCFTILFRKMKKFWCVFCFRLVCMHSRHRLHVQNKRVILNLRPRLYRRHTWRWSTLLRPESSFTRPPLNTKFPVFSKLCLQFRVLDMTEVY